MAVIRRPLARVLLFAAYVPLLVGCAGLTASQPRLSTEEVVRMSSGGVPDDEIIQRLKDSHTLLDLSWSRLATLREQGVPTRVLDYLEQSAREADRQRAIRDAGAAFPYPWGGGFYGWGPFHRWHH